MEAPAGCRQAQLPTDAFDIHRLLRAVDTAKLAGEFGILRSYKNSSRVTSGVLSMFRDLFGSRSVMGTELLVRSVEAVEAPAFTVASSVALGQELLKVATQWHPIPIHHDWIA